MELLELARMFDGPVGHFRSGDVADEDERCDGNEGKHSHICLRVDDESWFDGGNVLCSEDEACCSRLDMSGTRLMPKVQRLVAGMKEA